MGKDFHSTSGGTRPAPGSMNMIILMAFYSHTRSLTRRRFCSWKVFAEFQQAAFAKKVEQLVATWGA